MLSRNERQDTLAVYFHIAGTIIHTATEGMSEPGSTLTLCTCVQSVHFPGNTLFMTITDGKTFLSMDSPFTLRMGSNNLIKQDMPDGFRVVYVLKYVIDARKGMSLQEGGLVCAQHLGVHNHQTNLHILSSIMTPKMAGFSAQMAISPSDAACAAAHSSVSRMAELMG